jgi:hypothetical protein
MRSDTNHMVHTEMFQVAAFAEPIDGRGAHAEQLRDPADRKEASTRREGGKILCARTLDPIWTQAPEERSQIVPKVGSVRARDLQ